MEPRDIAKKLRRLSKSATNKLQPEIVRNMQGLSPMLIIFTVRRLAPADWAYSHKLGSLPLAAPRNGLIEQSSIGQIARAKA